MKEKAIKIIKNKWFLRIIGLLVFIFLFSKANVWHLWHLIGGANWILIIFTLLLSFVQIFFKNNCWRIFLSRQNIKISWWDSYKIYFIGLFWGSASPGRLGEAMRAVCLTRYQATYGQAFFSLLMDKFLDLVMLLFFTLVSVIYFSRYFTYQYQIILIIVFALLSLILLIRHHRYLFKAILKVFNKFLSVRYLNQLDLSLHEVNQNFNKITTKDYLKGLFYTSCMWLTYFFQTYLFAKSLSIPINYLQAAFMNIMTSSANILPITISGVGTRDLIYIYYFQSLHLPNYYELGLALSIIVFIFFMFNLTIGLIFWLQNPLSSDQAKN